MSVEKILQIRRKWKIRVYFKVNCLDKTLSVSLPSRYWVTGQVLHCINLHNPNWRRLHPMREKREDIVLSSLNRRKQLLSSDFAMRCKLQSWGEQRRYLDFLKRAPTGGHARISANKAPCQLEMHYVEIGKLLKEFQSKNVMFLGDLWTAECIWIKPAKNEEGITLSKLIRLV